MKMKATFACAVAVLLVALLPAAEVSSSQAKTAACNWVRKSPARMTAKFTSANARGVQTSSDADGRALYHVVALDGGGYVVTSGDTKLPPVIAFSDSGDFRLEDSGNPLLTLLERDMRRRTGLVDGEGQAATARQGTAVKTRAAQSEFEAEWAELSEGSADESVDGARGGGRTVKTAGQKSSSNESGQSATGLKSIADVRVPPIIKSKWGQGNWKRERTFNSLTPNNYDCGCVATAFGQIMRHWKMPTAAVAAKTRTCKIDGVALQQTMFGGTYDWDGMPLTSDECTTVRQRQAIGKLTYDIGVACYMDWSSAGSGSSGTAGMFALKEVFKYASVVSYLAISDYGLTKSLNDSSEFRNAILASLDAGMPCTLGVGDTATWNGHEVIADGYGLNGSVIYCHINCGWGGTEDMWYNLLGEGLTSYAFNFMDELTYNIHPTTEGDVISGRVLNAQGGPLSGATVTLSQGKTTKTATTDDMGIYYFRVTAGGTYSLKATHGGLSNTATTTLAMSRTTSVSLDGSGRVTYYNPSRDCGQLGNKWGVDIKLNGTPQTYIVRLHRNNSANDGATAGRTFTISKARALPRVKDELKWAPRTGYDFLGWAKTADATAAQYADAQSVRDITLTPGTTVHLYAVWKPHKYIVRLHRNNSANDGATTGRAFDYDQVRFLPTMAELKWVRNGYMFLGWSQAQSSSTVKYADGLNVFNLSPNNGEELRMWGVWKVAPAGAYLLRLHRNNSERDGATAGRQLTLNTYRRLPTVKELGWARSDRKFKGWATTAKNADAGTIAYSEGANVRNLANATGATVHLYAVWQ